jgi:hypothetical protein
MSEAAGSDLDKAAELIGTVKQFLKVMGARRLEALHERRRQRSKAFLRAHPRALDDLE